MFPLILCLCLLTPFPALSKQATIYMKQGQLQNDVIEVFVVDAQITSVENTRLRLTAPRYFSSNSQFPAEGIAPLDAVIDQQRSVTVRGKPVTKTGTVLFFDKLSSYDLFGLMPVIQFVPVLNWDGGGQASSQDIIFLGDRFRAFAYALALMALFLILIAVMVRRGEQRFVHLFCDKSLHLSLSRTQVGLWTMAIGGMVVGYGLVKIEVPDIPESLVALMGLSLATGSIVYLKDKSNLGAQTSSGGDATTKIAVKPQLGDLVREYSDGGKGELSISRAQMVFWTGITLVLFIFKSLVSGQLWQVPWEMVALMGISQASYLVPKVSGPGK